MRAGNFRAQSFSLTATDVRLACPAAITGCAMAVLTALLRVASKQSFTDWVTSLASVKSLETFAAVLESIKQLLGSEGSGILGTTGGVENSH